MMRYAFVTICAMAMAAQSGFARAGTTTGLLDYYTIGENDQDTNHLAGGAFDNEVQSTLGPDGLPVLNTAQFGCTSNCFSSTNAPADVTSTGELTYWSPALNQGGAGGASDITFTGSAVVNLPFNNTSFYPPNGGGSDDSNGFQAATLTATLQTTQTEQISFNVGADDVAFVFLDGQVVCDLGGIHGNTAGTCVSPFDISAGAHTLNLFYADLEQTGAGLTFGINTQDVSSAPPSTVPEPGSLAMLASGAAVLGGLGLMKRKKAVLF